MKERQTWLQKQPDCLGMPPPSATRGELRSEDSKEGRACMLGGFSHVQLFVTPWIVARQDTQGLFRVPDTMDELLESSEASQALQNFTSSQLGPDRLRTLPKITPCVALELELPDHHVSIHHAALEVLCSQRNTSLSAIPSEDQSWC